MIANKLRINVGDRIHAYFIEDESVKTRKYTISGIYQTNMTRFDEAICFSDIYSVNKINGWGSGVCSDIEVTVQDLNSLSASRRVVYQHDKPFN